VHRKQFTVQLGNKQLCVFHHRMMRADRSLSWTNGRLFWRPGWCALWWEMMGWKPSLMNWVSVVFFPSLFNYYSFTICDVLHSSFMIIVPSSGWIRQVKYFRYSKRCCIFRGVWVLTHFFKSSTPGDVFIQPAQDERNPVVYGVFSTSGYTPAFSFIHLLLYFFRWTHMLRS